MKKAFVLFFTASISTAILILFIFFSFNDHKLHIVICDVGQGDAILIITPSQAQFLIDGGPDKSVLSCLSSHMPFWDRSIDAVILTHPHADHITGLIQVIKGYKVGGFYTEKVDSNSQIYKLLKLKLAEKKVSARYLQRGDKFRDGAEIELETISPSLETLRKTDQNNSNLDLNGLSVIELLKYGHFKMLLTGDAGVKVEDKIASGVGDIDVLKVPHHGSRTGMSDYYLATIKPELAVVSVGAKNRYGHPAPLSLNLLKKHRTKMLRTDRDGEVEIVSDGSTWTVKSSRN